MREVHGACQGEHIFIRHDIGKEELIQKRIDHMSMLR